MIGHDTKAAGYSAGFHADDLAELPAFANDNNLTWPFIPLADGPAAPNGADLSA